MVIANHKNYPCVFIKKAVIFPTEKVPLVLEGKRVAIEQEGLIIVAFQKNGEVGEMAVLGKIIQFWNLTVTIMGVIVEGRERVRIIKNFTQGNVNMAEAEIPVMEAPDKDSELIAEKVFENFKMMVQLEGIMPIFLVDEIQKNNLDPQTLSFVIGAAMKLNFKDKLEIFEMLETKKRLEMLLLLITKKIEILKTEKKIQTEVEKEINKTQKEYILRERMKAIEKELGISEEYKEFDELEKRIKKALMPEKIEAVALKELARLKAMPATSAETPYIRTYLDLLIELPWNIKEKSVIDFKRAKRILDNEHYGLEKVKERIIEYLAVQKLIKKKGQTTIMCFIGPPGTGKTSVGKSIARALGRKFHRLSLGGIRDEAEIRGHRRTYVGALPGRIIQGIKTVATKNPVFMLDEIDKIGQDFRGDPSAALLEVLDPEQNNSFSDHYLEVPFDLSEVFFITTANIIDSIPPTLRDRMEVIEFSSYTSAEKFSIATKFLIPRVLEANGLDKEELMFENQAIKKIIEKYTKEAGVRNLERKLSEIARKVAKKFVEKEKQFKISVKANELYRYLGPEDFQITMGNKKDEVGVSTGMAWTPAGGEIIFIEAVAYPGKGKLILTGQLRESTQDSARAALSYLRSVEDKFKLKSKDLEKLDIHVHVPGSLPKDGPSAGIAIATALASLLNRKKVRKEVALTGEITLSGKVLEVGGIKEKVIAAHRAGVKTIIMPRENEKHLHEVPSDIRKDLSFKFVSNMEEVFKNTFK
ncbi:MAG: Lon protease [Candidatus Falkowbacteria bacterium GW2011_GWF2_39_8]|uniref:Lon protease n=1 Tax=Candidatus Falkowbacteria bacterium GW2011_GWF2_39_8 TaxID=1618642 RepID=A0A0G0T0U7_9BACT|nr:MAG: Lon protease [Candidatus Falkowbacteria bacterium GW2011_GWF2_39_8]